LDSSKKPTPSAPLPPAQLAKAALRRLALEKLEPTPDNFTKAYQLEAGDETGSLLPAKALTLIQHLAEKAFAPPQAEQKASEIFKAAQEGRWEIAERLIDEPDDSGAALASLIEKLIRQVEISGKQWTKARKKESLQRVLSGSRSDAGRLQQRLRQLMVSWEEDKPDQVADPEATEAEAEVASASENPLTVFAPERQKMSAADNLWSPLLHRLGGSVSLALPPTPALYQEMSEALSALTHQIQQEGPQPGTVQELTDLCERVDMVLQHRHHLVDQLGHLCSELTGSLGELAENDSWTRGQCEAMRIALDDGLTSRGVKSVIELLADTRRKQTELRFERERARDALKAMINRMLIELGELGSHTGRFQNNVARYADVIQQADSLESLAGVVEEMVHESKTVHELVSQTQQRLNEEHTKATGLSQKVVELENEIHRLSEEVYTDQLTNIANRRGLLAAFDAQKSLVERGAMLSVGLLDIDNFKRLNDELGHSAGDEALKSLAEVISQSLRPSDKVARYGGEEFVVLLPDTPIDEGQQILTRLQRSLSVGLFMHENKKIFVTFSAGVTQFKGGETLEVALERADQALYEAKRTGKNRTCIG
jgi:diguanylate cyclase